VGNRGKTGTGRLLVATSAIAIATLSPSISTGVADAAANSSGAPIKIGLTLPVTGPLGGQLAEEETGAQTRIKQLNAGGGIHGRKLQLIAADDQYTPQGALTAVKSLVAQGVVGVIDTDALTTGAGAQYLQAQHIPISENTANPASIADQDIFSPLGSSGPSVPASASMGKFLASLGVSTIAGVGWGQIAQSASLVEGQLSGANKGGVKTVLTDLSPSPTTADFTPDVLKIKQSGAQSVTTAMTNSANITLMYDLKQQGVNLKAKVFSGSPLYDESVLKDPEESALEGAYIQSWFAPAGLKTSTEKSYLAVVKKYSPGSFAGFYFDYGYVLADLMVQGVERTQGAVTGANIIKALSKITKYTGAGIIPKAINFTISKTAPQNRENCFWYVQIKNKQFVDASSKPICG
jgi:branched-chain amino acid transport system substrate-binding protein